MSNNDPFAPLDDLARDLNRAATEAWAHANASLVAGDDDGHEREAMEAEMLDEMASLVRRAIIKGRSIAAGDAMTHATLAQMRRDKRTQTAIFGLKVFGPAAIFLAVLYWTLR